MTPEETRLFNRAQLVNVIKDVAERADETNEPAVSCVLYGLCAAIMEGSDPMLAHLVATFAQARLDNDTQSHGSE